MSRYRDSNSDCKVYVGDLGSSASKQDLEDAFGYYGPLRNVWVARNPPGFAFVEFEDARDADDAVRGLDGRTVCGRRIRVEASNGHAGRRRSGGGRGPPSRRGRPFNPDDRCYECGEKGHYARDCKKKGGRHSRRSASRSRSRDRRSRSKSSRSRSRDRRSKSSVRSDEKRVSNSRSRSRSRGSGRRFADDDRD